MNKIQEVVHKFRSGGGDKKDSNSGSRGGGGAARTGVGGAAVRVSTQQMSSTVHTISSGNIQGDGHDRTLTTKWYVEPPLSSQPDPRKPGLKTVSVMQSAEPVHKSELGMLLTSQKSTATTAKTELSSLPMLTQSGLQQTMLAALNQSDPLSALTLNFEDDSPSNNQANSPEKKQGRSFTQPKGTLEYKIERGDTLEKIAAKFDTTPSLLKKLNRMSSRLVFEGMIVFRPDPTYRLSNPPTPEPSPPPSPVLVMEKPKLDIPLVKRENKPPGKMPGHILKMPSPPPSAAPALQSGMTADTDAPPALLNLLSEDEARKMDEECYERFIKVFAKNCFEGSTEFGRIGVKGTLIITPNAIMFDPDPKDEAVAIYGADSFGMVVYMDCVLSVALYHNLNPEIKNAKTPQSPSIISEKSELYYGDIRSRSASTSQLLTSKPRGLNILSKTFQISTSKSMSGFIATDDSQKSTSGLSPFNNAGGTKESTTDDAGSGSGLKSIMSLSADAIKIVGDTLLKDSGITVKVEGVVTEESNTDPTSAVPLVTVDVDNATQVDIDTELKGGSMAVRSPGGVPAPSNKGMFEEDRAFPNCSGSQDKTNSSSQPGSGGNTTHLDDMAQLCNNADISAFLAGGRRDSLRVTGSNLQGGVNLFYPPAGSLGQRALKDVDRRPVDSSGGLTEWGEKNKETDVSPNQDAMMIQCADKLVTDILESVTQQGKGEKPSIEGTCVEEPLKPDGSLVERDDMVAQDENRIGSIQYLPVQEDGNGDMVVFNSPIDPSDHAAEFSSSSKTALSGGAKPKNKPAPLANLGVGDDTDGGSGEGSASSTEGPRGRASSTGSFSPLRSSAQHLSNFVNYATGFFRSSNEDRTFVRDVSDIPVVSHSEEVGRRRALSGDSAHAAKKKWAEDTAAARAREKPDVCRQNSNDETAAQQLEEGESKPPIYLELRVDDIECDRRITSSHAPSRSYVGQKTRDRYLFSIPRSKADHLYAFFVHWTPQKYGDEDDIDPEERGFVIVDKEDLDNDNNGDSKDILEDYFQATPELKKDWEIISKGEARRRESVAVDITVMPELSHESTILSKRDIIELAESLPPRTIGYKWQLVYSTARHGISLNTLYREVIHMDCPVLLVIRDTDYTVFGAFLSDPPKKSDHFFGTGICQLFTFKDKFRSYGWAGENDFFIKGDDKSLTVGSGHGKYGLWLDGDLYHGRSRQCSTFNNIVLSGKEDFFINTLELWAFLMD